MAKGFLVRAQTVKEAIEKARRMYGETAILETRVVNSGGRGFLGLLRKDAEVWVEIDGETPPDDEGPVETGEDPAGEPDANRVHIAVRGGRVFVEHPKDGPFPVLVPGEKVILKVNGEPVDDVAVVTSEDRIEVMAMDTVKDGRWSLHIDEDRLEARVFLVPTVVIKRRIKDDSGESELTLTTEEEVLQRSPVSTIDEVMKRLFEAGITYGINWKRCAFLDEINEERSVVVAKGDPPLPGRDASIKLLFDLEEKRLKDVAEDERVDFRERYEFTTVKPGEMMAVKIPAEPGTAGMTITGEPLPPPPVMDLELVPGEGTTVVGEKIFATNEGRPLLLKNGRRVVAKVVPYMVHRGDVDLASGNISFSGDVMVTGNVTEEMQVKAGGEVVVSGLVSHAFVQAGGAVTVYGNALSSVLVAGGMAAFEEFQESLRLVQTEFSRLLKVIHQVSGNRNFHRTLITPLVKTLLEGKFSRVKTALQTCAEEIVKIPSEMKPEGAEETIQLLNKSVIEPENSLNRIEQLEKMQDQITEMVEKLGWEAVPKADIVVSYALKSTLIASGEVKVVGKGCYNSRIESGGKVMVKGIFRGGEIIAGGDVSVGEFGSELGVSGKIVAAHGSRVKLGRVYENSVVQIGEKSHRFDSEASNVVLFVGDDGNIAMKG